MQSTYLSRSLFGCTRISLISAAVFVGQRCFRPRGQLNKQEFRKVGLDS